MAEDLTITRNTSKEEQYQSIIPQIDALLYGETDLLQTLQMLLQHLKNNLIGFG
jgi:L-methionine (R)-S-oxide reductase